MPASEFQMDGLFHSLHAVLQDTGLLSYIRHLFYYATEWRAALGLHFPRILDLFDDELAKLQGSGNGSFSAKSSLRHRARLTALSLVGSPRGACLSVFLFSQAPLEALRIFLLGQEQLLICFEGFWHLIERWGRLTS